MSTQPSTPTTCFESCMPKGLGGATLHIPRVGLGIFACSDTDWYYQAVLKALRVGYRHIDGAWEYVDDQVGRAIRDSGVPRSDIFVTSKFWPQFMHPENVGKCLNMVLHDTNLEFVDPFLAHWLVAFKANSHIGEGRAKGEAGRAGYGNGHLGIEKGQAIVKNRMGWQIDLEHSAANIGAQFGVRDRLCRHGSSRSWSRPGRGTIPLGKSQNEERIKSNFNIKVLPKEDFDAVSSLNKRAEGRVVNFSDDWGVRLVL